MRFVLLMAARETRSSWRRLLFFFICIAVGVAAIVALRSVIQNVREVFSREAKSLIAADVLITTNREWTPKAREIIDRRLAEAGATTRTETIETPTMVRPADQAKAVARMVELRGVQSAFPIYGSVELMNQQPYSHALLEGHGALVRPELLTALGVAVGDQLLIGQATFTIRGLIAKEPGRGAGQFSLGPRVLVDYDDIASTKLLGFGSRAERTLLVRAPDDRVQPLVRDLRQDLREEFANARSYRATDDQIGRDFDRAENYLSLVGLIVVILGGIAVSSVTRVFILQKIRSIAVLKCVGARTRQIMAIYVLQVTALGLAGSLLGLLIARLAVSAIPLALGSSSTSLLAEAHYGVTWSAGVQGVAIGVLVSLLFSVVPLLHVRFVRPSLLLRDEAGPKGPRDWTRIAAVVIVSFALVGVAAWQAASIKVGVVLCIGFAVLAFVLHLAGLGLVKLVAPLARSRSFPLRHAVLHLSRPGNQTRVILLAVGLGAFFIVGVRSLQASLLSEFSIEVSADAPDMFLLDIQRDQAAGVRAFLSAPGTGAGRSQLIPVLRARVTAVTGRDTHLEDVQQVRRRGSLAREYTVTYRNQLEPNERVVAGAWWSGPSSEPEVSVEKGLHERFDINVGDTMRFDVLGRVITARVANIRDVEWRDSRNGGFMFVFRPGIFEDAPQTYVAPLKGPNDVQARARFQHDLVTKFPNVSVIDFHEILDTVRDVMSKVTLAISVVGGLVLFSGALILVGAVAMTKFQRVYEAAVFKTLGASTATIAKMLLFEYGVLGALAGLIGSLGAVALTWGVSRYALEIPWRIFVTEHVAGLLLTAILVAAVGVLSSLDVLRNKPLATLRAE
ncbi:MAG TPA: FtsX-like permease family protein [Vicinamibacterales bacterium]|nr:FtsX-like permease family protein [Vicinamibacterales bacterium]